MYDDTPDRIERRALFRASRSRIWQAISDAREFGHWFGAKLEGAFAEGTSVCGHVSYPGYEHLRIEMQVERMEPERLFSYHRLPYPADPEADCSGEPTTLVEFHLDDTESGGTLLRIVETGFSRLPDSRREEAYRMNDEGWAEQLENLRDYIERG